MSTRIGPPKARTTVAEDGAPPYGFQGCHGVLFAEDIWVRVVPTARVTSFHGIPACMGALYGEDEDDSSFKDARSSVALDEDQSSAAPQTRPPTPSFAPPRYIIFIHCTSLTDISHPHLHKYCHIISSRPRALRIPYIPSLYYIYHTAG